MKLKYQLLLLALLSLVFPVSGWIALKSVDTEFRQAMEQAAKNTLISLKASVRQIIKNNPDFQLQGLVVEHEEKIIPDGDDSDWLDIQAYIYQQAIPELHVKIAESQGDLYLLLYCNDKTDNMFSPDSSEYDYVIIALADKRGLYKFSFVRQAEGNIIAISEPGQNPEYQAYWHEQSDGYVLEVKFKGTDYHHLGFATVDDQGEGKKFINGTLVSQKDKNLKLQPLLALNHEFASAIEDITSDNNSFVIKDLKGRIIYESNKLPNNPSVSAWQWLITPLYQWLFGIEDNNSNWFYRYEDGMAGVQHTVTEDGLVYELQSMLPQGQQNMIQTLLKAGIFMILVVMIIMLSYLLYSLMLAWRIKRLNRALQTVLDDSGRLNIEMPSHSAGDEIGELSRGIESMLGEMREYTQYLKDLGSRLSHEMKTPLAIVQSSLDNLDMEFSQEFLQRAKLGTNRLKFILNQLSELSKLKYTLENTPKENFNLSRLYMQLGESYKSFIPNLEFEAQEDIFVYGSSDLMAQMIDKIVDNAVDFTPKEGIILMQLTSEGKTACLSIINSGSQLPDSKISIFDSLVSNRRQKDKKSHLGLGLYISQLIARFHGGKIIAENLEGENKVSFSIKLDIVVL